MKKKINGVVVTICAAILSSAAQASDLTIGVPSWPSASVTAYVMKDVLEENLGLEISMQTGSNPIIWEAIDRGTIQVHPEVWLPNQQNLYNKYVKDKGTAVKNEHGILAKQGLCITKEMSKKSGIASIYDLTDPDKAALLDSNGDGVGEIWAGAPGAASTTVEKIRAKSYGYDQTVTLTEVDTPVNWAALDSAERQGKPYVFSCYTPHHVFSMYDIVFLDEPNHDPNQWHIIQPTDDPNWLESSQASTGWPAAYVQPVYAKSLEGAYPQAALILKNFRVSADILSAWSYGVVVDKKSAQEVAKEWVKDNSDQINQWLGL
ncbi:MULTISPECIES: glycine betaine ABC transporter substrate-binding protein [unclassified Vibrio]|uniref:Glycine betaine ABC transporter substrate-binding protein n=1 Tax=Vibrio sp. HB236076 TaxID=3232307 RepID=A0AB39HDS3_9VIBR|nr:glycine betaine ABC transporter substrate-binding protein [Vibrio sp. HB161653]MDP5255024.1 glycine betaine ABC transporter substrate-binding protein [Vibrio sp. HB161653]